MLVTGWVGLRTYLLTQEGVAIISEHVPICPLREQEEESMITLVVRHLQWHAMSAKVRTYIKFGSHCLLIVRGEQLRMKARWVKLFKDFIIITSRST